MNRFEYLRKNSITNRNDAFRNIEEYDVEFSLNEKKLKIKIK